MPGPVTCEWDGIVYPSITAAAEVVGVSVYTMWRWVQQGLTSTAQLEERNRKRENPRYVGLLWRGEGRRPENWEDEF